MKLVICEKPSVAKSIASTLGVTSRAGGCFEGNGFIVSWCVGHLVSPMDAAGYDPGYKKWRYDDLPILPEPFRYVLVKGKEDAFQNLKRLMERPDVTELVNACDAGREGELIFRLVYEMAGCTKPFSRLWISSMEDTAIREGFADLRPGAEYDPLYQSALCRQKADWLIGINATRLFSVLYHRTLNVGRVQTPTLAMLVDRDWKVTSFKKEKYHHVRLALDGTEAVSERITSPEEAETLRAACADGPAVCTSVTREQKKEAPPKLYDLTTLQREANRIFGYTAKQTLDYAQSLYEKKLLTYPRTDSRYLTADMAETAAAVLHLAAKVPPFDGCGEFFPDVSLLVNDKKVSDHHAIIPTLELEKADLSELPVGERNILLLVCRELLCAVAEPYVYEAVTATFTCGGQTFTAKGRRILSEGWREIDHIFRASLKEQPEGEAEPAALPDFTEGQLFDQVEAAVTEHFTAPPKAYTEDTLLSAMENAGKEEILDAVSDRMFLANNPFEAVRGRTDLNALQKMREAIRLNQADEDRARMTASAVPLTRNPRLLLEMIESNRRILTPYYRELLEEGNRDGSVCTPYAREIAELLPLLTSLWLLPAVFPATKAGMRRKFDYGTLTTWKTGVPEWSGRAGVRFKHALSETVDFNADVYGRFSSNSVEKTESETTHYNNWQTANVAFGFEFGDEKQYTVAAEVLNLFDKRYRQDDSILEPGLHANIKVGMRF